MPIFLILSSGTNLIKRLPPVMRKGLVGLGHAVYIVPFLDRSSTHVGGVVQFVRQFLAHALLRARPRVADDPAHSQRGPAVLRHLDRHLVVGPAHAPRLHFQQRLGVFYGLLESLERIVAGALAQLVHGLVEDPLGGLLLACPHHGIDELLHQGGVVDRVRRYFTNDGSSSSWHTFLRFGTLGSIFRPALPAVCHARGIQCAANDVVTHTGEILHAATANEHDRVLLQVVPDPGYISGYFDSVGQPDARDFPQRRVRLLGGGCIHARANSALLRAALERRAGGLPAWRLPPLTHKLVKRRHEFSSSRS